MQLALCVLCLCSISRMEQSPEVRLESLRGLTRLYSNADFIEPLDLFTQRFKVRCVL
jgi:hypothetical protein